MRQEDRNVSINVEGERDEQGSVLEQRGFG
jgi:hypothetical protein